MQSMYSNCYDRTIAELVERRKKMKSAKQICIIEKAIRRLEEERNMPSIEAELKTHAPVVLNKIYATDRQPGSMMKVITQEFFDIVKTPDGQKFEKMGLEKNEDVYSLNAKSGTYIFTVKYISDSNQHYIILMREQSTTNRERRLEAYFFNKFPRFVSNHKDVEIIKRNFMRMLVKLARCWKYLKSNSSPSNSTSPGPSTNSRSESNDDLELENDFLKSVVQ